MELASRFRDISHLDVQTLSLLIPSPKGEDSQDFIGVFTRDCALFFVRYYWTPAPPKLHLTPSVVRDQMFPAYQGAPVLKDTLGPESGTMDMINDDSEDDEDDLDKMDPEDREARER